MPCPPRRTTHCDPRSGGSAGGNKVTATSELPRMRLHAPELTTAPSRIPRTTQFNEAAYAFKNQ
eukprot:1004723-Heterocapsa_arctica.AAC.1